MDLRELVKTNRELRRHSGRSKHAAYARWTMLIDHVSTASVNLVPVEVPLHAARTRAEEVQRNASAMSS